LPFSVPTVPHCRLDDKESNGYPACESPTPSFQQRPKIQKRRLPWDTYMTGKIIG